VIDQTIARPGQESTREPEPAYVLRGHGLFEIHRDELTYIGGGRWLVPSGSKEGLAYEVRVSTTRPERQRCECTGFMHHGHCSHLVAARIAHRRSAVCDCCGERRYWPELQEVQGEDELLTWFPGDHLCRTCIDSGAWA
jgi:hypothetical protein